MVSRLNARDLQWFTGHFLLCKRIEVESMYKRKKNPEVMKGLDSLVFSVHTFKALQTHSMELYTQQGNKYGYVQCFSNRMEFVLNLPKARGNTPDETNLIPYSVTDLIMIELIRDDITEKLKTILGDNFTSSIKTCGLSYNLPVETNEEINNLISLLRNVFLEEKRQSAVYYIKSMNVRMNLQVAEASGYLSPLINGRMRFKVYNKGKELGLQQDYLRFEIILMQRHLKRLFGCEMSIRSILTKEHLSRLLKEFRCIYENVIMPKISNELSNAVERLAYRMIETEKPVQAFLELQRYEQVYTLEVFRRALTKYYSYVDKEKDHRNNINRLCFYVKKQYGLNNRTLELFKEMHFNC